MVRLPSIFLLSIIFIPAAFCQKKDKLNASSISSDKGTNQTRSVLNLNTSWAFYRGDIIGAEKINYPDSAWTAVTIPHTMRLERKHNGGEVYQGIGWYRRYLKIGKSAIGKRLTINFEGVQMNCEVFLNGEKLTSHYGGYLGFVVNITDKVKFDQDNVLAVRVSNLDDPLTPPGKAQSKLDFNYYGGIYRNVTLNLTNKLYISDPVEAQKTAGGGLFVTYPKVDEQRAEINIMTDVVSEDKTAAQVTLISIIKDVKGNEVAQTTSKAQFSGHHQFEQGMILLKPKLWHPEHPYLYNLTSRVYSGSKLIDVKTTPIGIRTISFKSPSGKADGFYINGKKLYLRGANRHQNYQYIGDAASNSMQYRDALQIKKAGFNAVRAAHYPQSTAFLDACDQLGLMVIECEPGWQFFNSDTVFQQRTYQNVREMIRRDRNRPSVFLWETSLNESPTPDYWAKEIVKIAHEEMPNNQMFTADDFFAKGKKFYDVSYKVVNEDGTDPMPAMPSLTREWGDSWMADPAKENSLRASRIYTEKGFLAQCILRQNALNGSMLEKDGAYWDHAKLDANERISGYFLWTYNDYTRGADPVTAFSGVVDVDRYEKFGYYQMQSMQDARNAVYGPMVYIASYNNQPGTDSSLIVFSNCDAIRLYRNGTFLEEKTRKGNASTAPYIASKGGSPYYLFNTGNYEAGELKAEGLINGNVVTTHKIATPGAPDHLEIEIADRGINLIADQSDMVPFYIKVCDKNGTLISNSMPLQAYQINIAVTGEGKLVGENIPGLNIANQQTEGGIAYGIIRATKQAGNIVITAGGQGFKTVSKTIRSSPYKGVYAEDGSHVRWSDDDKEITGSATSLPVKKAELPPVIKFPPENISLEGKEGAKGLANILDNNVSTTWYANKESLPAILKIDLGREFTLKGSKVIWGKDSDWYTYALEISSDGLSWEKVIKDKNVSGQDYMPVLYHHEKVRFVRITIYNVTPDNSKAAISDLVFYGYP